MLNSTILYLSLWCKILDLKNKIKDQKGFDVESQKIVFKGKATTNTDELDKLGVKEGDFLVVMTTVKVLALSNKRNPNIKRNKKSDNNPKKNKQNHKFQNKRINHKQNHHNSNSNNNNHNNNNKIKPVNAILVNLCQWDSQEIRLSRH